MSYNLGVIHLTTGQYASAFHYFSTAINLQPTYGRSYTYLALALSRLDDFENACAAYDKAIELGEDHITHLNYAITLYINDEPERSKEHFHLFEKVFANSFSVTCTFRYSFLLRLLLLLILHFCYSCRYFQKKLIYFCYVTKVNKNKNENFQSV
jgi:tetratricopeptide (TPR) repeat protein